MARLAGIELNDSWKLNYALTKIKGIGWSRAGEIMKDLRFKDSLRVSDVSAADLSRIAGKLESFTIEGDLERTVRENVQRLKVTGSYRGIRHGRGLPSRGQRTKSNARTKRGSRKTVGAFKKDMLAKMTASNK
jgi:small subunit ribosomal protein S13